MDDYLKDFVPLPHMTSPPLQVGVNLKPGEAIYCTGWSTMRGHCGPNGELVIDEYEEG